VSDFTPGVERAKAAGYRIDVQPYPLGEAGIELSLDTVAKKIRDGRLDPDIRGWAGDVLIAAGKPTGVRDQAQALLDAFRQQTMYVSDPVGAEYIVSGAATACLRPGLCVKARDCDDGVVFMGSALLSIGIPALVIKQDFGADKQQHVLVAAQDENGEWLAVDPSTSLPVGQRVKAVSEEIIDPMEVVGSAGTSGAEIVTLGHVTEARALSKVGGVWRERRYGRQFAWTGAGWVEETPTRGLAEACCAACARGEGCSGKPIAAAPAEDETCTACELYQQRRNLGGVKIGPLVLLKGPGLGDAPPPGIGFGTVILTSAIVAVAGGVAWGLATAATKASGKRAA
jgi:hypothetical protein